MSLLRRRMMMETMELGAKYPLVNGRHEFSDGSYVEISNGNHIMFYKSTNDGGFINISDISQNSDTIGSVQNINYKPKIYTIPAGVQTRFELKNIQISGNFAGETNFRIANGSRSGSFHTGKFDAGNPSNNTVIETILETPEEVGCLFLYFNGKADVQVKFDVEFTVGDERWI